MNVDNHIFGDIDTLGGGAIPPSTAVLPPPCAPYGSETGFGSGYTNRGVHQICAIAKEMQEVRRAARTPRWYTLRVTYGREKKAYEYLVGKNVEAYYPTIKTVKLVNGKRRTVEESRLPNIFFVRGTEEEIKSYVYDNVNLPYLRFYYRHFHERTRIVKEPLVVPDCQIDSLKIICASEAEDILIVPSHVKKFKAGQEVRITDGSFKGVRGRVARYQGQQRVAVAIDGLLTIATAYIPSAFLCPVAEE